MGAPHNIPFVMKLAFIFAALVAVAAAIPSTDIETPESVLFTETEVASPEYNEAADLLQKNGANACDDLAKATEDEVKNNINAQQNLLNNMDKGASCPNEGQAGIQAAQKEESRAKQAQADAQTNLNNAQNKNINWGTSRFNSVKKGDCNVFYNSQAYKTPENAVNAANTALNQAKGKYTEAQRATATAKEAAKKMVKDCQCKAYKAVQSAHTSKSNSAHSANLAAWTKAAHLRCVLKGTSPSKCTVPSMPKLTVPKLASGVDASACGAETSGALAFSHGWANYGGSYGSVTVSRRDGMVVVQGLVKGSSWGNVMFTLPADKRPSKQRLMFNVDNHAKSARVDVQTNGHVSWHAGGKDHGWVSVSGIAFSQTGNGVTLHNTWQGYGGICAVNGLVKTSNNWGHMATLAAACRPQQRLIFNLNNHENMARVDVLTNGQVHWITGGKSHNWLSLSGINFAVSGSGATKNVPMASGWSSYGHGYGGIV